MHIGSAMLIIGILYLMALSKGFRITVFVLIGMLTSLIVVKESTFSHYREKEELSKKIEHEKHCTEYKLKYPNGINPNGIKPGDTNAFLDSLLIPKCD